jgi:hypothetical protein
MINVTKVRGKILCKYKFDFPPKRRRQSKYEMKLQIIHGCEMLSSNLDVTTVEI